MKFNTAYTAAINPPSASPILSQLQFWDGLIEKCRRPEDSLPVIANCEILEESDNGMKRIVTFRPGMGPPGGKATEIITFHGKTTVRNLLIYLWWPAMLTNILCVQQRLTFS